MKKLIFVLLFVLGVLAGYHTKAQVNFNINIAAQPLWGPVGYERVDYYYLPDIETYYYVPNRQFIFLNNGQWVFQNSMPARYTSYDLYSGYKVVVNEPRPWLQFNTHKVKYAKYKNTPTQMVIMRSNDPKYFVIKGHPHGMPPGQAKKLGEHGNGKNKNK